MLATLSTISSVIEMSMNSVTVSYSGIKSTPGSQKGGCLDSSTLPTGSQIFSSILSLVTMIENTTTLTISVITNC